MIPVEKSFYNKNMIPVKNHFTLSFMIICKYIRYNYKYAI